MSEAPVYAYASRYFPDYTGEFRHFYCLPDGGGFMAPDEESLNLCNKENWFEQTVSGEVAGIIITALVLNRRSWHLSHNDREELCRHFCRRYEQLMAFDDNHPDSTTIIWGVLN